jgi:hypothetical protein
MDLVPETFVDAFGEISFKHGMIRIELASLSGPEPRVTQRLITSLQAFRQMLQAQNGMLEQLEKAGVIRPAQPVQAPAEAEPPSERSGVVAAVRRLARIEPVPQPAGPPAATPAAAALGPPKSPNFSDDAAVPHAE